MSLASRDLAPFADLLDPCLPSSIAASRSLTSALIPHPHVTSMPGICFAEVRAMVSFADVLDLVGFIPGEVSGDQVRGPCPVHGPTSPRSRSFSAHLKRNVYECFTCGSSGNQLDLYAAVTGL